LVVEDAPDDASALEAALADIPLTRIGMVQDDLVFHIAIDGTLHIHLPVEQLIAAWLRLPTGVAP
jgi:hypothetical protein